MGKNSFIIYHEYAEHFEMLDDAELGQLIRAIMEYEQHQTIPNLPKHLALAFSFIKKDLDYNRDKYEEICEKNKLNGKKGGRPPKTERLSEETQKSERFLEKPKKAEYDLELDLDLEREYEHDKEKDIKHIAHPQADRAKDTATLDDDFEKLWSHYPKERRVGKKKARERYMQLVSKHKVAPETLLQGVVAYADWCHRNCKEPQHIKHLLTWLNGEHWNDELIDDAPVTPVWEKERQRRETESDMAAERVKAMLAGGEIDLLGGG
jgi:hypothetical protein